MATLNQLTYREYTGRSGESPAVWQFASDGVSVAVTYDVDRGIQDNTPFNIARNFLGYSFSDPRPGMQAIRRVLPFSHSRSPSWLWAEKITSCRGVGKWTWTPAPAGTGQVGFAQFETYRTTVLFTTRNFQVLPDAAVTKEFQRWVSWSYDAGIEVIDKQVASTADQWVFADGPPGVILKRFPRSIQARSPKSTLSAVWHEVPHSSIFGPNHVLSNNLANGLATMNDADWPAVSFSTDILTAPRMIALANLPAATRPPLTFKKNTLLLKQIGLRPSSAPVPPLDTGARFNSSVSRMWDVSLIFSVFDPPTDPRYPNYRGHCLAPSISTDPASAPFYYLLTAGGEVDGPRIYPEYDFDKLFQPL